MGLLQNVIVAILAVSLLTFVALFGQLPALRRTPIGWLQRALCLHVPRALKRLDHSISGGRVTRGSLRTRDYLFNENNPVVLIFYLFILTGSASLFLHHTLHRLPWGLLWPITFILPAPYVFTYLCVSYSAHYITTANHENRMTDYPYDHILYRPRAMCRTCHLPKPPRSKHCSLCGVCVAKSDHHCPWVYNCLGRGNYRYFLAMLVSLDVLQIYGAYLSWWILSPHLNIDPNNSFFSLAFLADCRNAVTIAVRRGGTPVAGVGFFAAATSPLPFGLFAYHCYLIWAGMTTNESQKWSDWKDDMTDGLVYSAPRAVLEDHNRRRKNIRSEDTDNPALSVFEEREACSNWPQRSTVTLVRTRDGKPPQGQEHLWSRVGGLDEVVNIYDVGVWQNIGDVLYGK